jgi:hypothetical protein
MSPIAARMANALIASRPGDRDEPTDVGLLQGGGRQSLLGDGDLLADQIQFMEGRSERGLLVQGQQRRRLLGEPATAAFPKEITPRTAGDQVALENGLDAILQARALLDQTGAVSDLVT